MIKEIKISKFDKFKEDNKNSNLYSKDGYEFILKEKVDKKHINIQFLKDNYIKCVTISSLLGNNILRYSYKEMYEGKIIENKQGLKALVLEYINIYKVKIQFLDTNNIIVCSLDKIKNKTFKENFEKTYIDTVKNELLNKELYTKDNLYKYKIIDVISSSEIKIQFEDKTIRKYTAKDIVNNNIKYTYDKNNAIGKEFLNYKGEKAIIIKYDNSLNIDLKFEDGELCTNVSMGNIKKGLFVKDIDNKKDLENLKNKYIGYVFTSKNGVTAKVLDYIDNKHIYVEFEDGYKCFLTLSNLSKSFSHPLYSNKSLNNNKSKYEGTYSTTNSGYKIKILTYFTSKKVLIEFVEDKSQKYVSMSNIKTGQISHPNDELSSDKYREKFLNRTFISNSGEKIKVINYINSKNIEILFEDGTKNKVTLDKLREGKFTNPKYSYMNKEAMANTMLGKEFKNNYGLCAICTKYENTNNVELTFEDGVSIISSKENILRKNFLHPNNNQFTYSNNFYVYRMLDKDNNIIYVGRSINLSIRLYIHFSKHIKDKNKSWYYLVDRIQYITCKDFLEMCNCESYLITKYKPIGNNKNEPLKIKDFVLNESELKWDNFDLKFFNIYQKI